MNVSLLMPVGFSDSRREAIFYWVLKRWMVLYPEWQICLGKDEPEDFNRSKARNAAFQQSDGEILVITDADTATTPENVQQAIEIVARTNAWVIAHQTYFSVDEQNTNLLLLEPCDYKFDPMGFSSSRCDWVMRNRSEAGVLVMTREAYEAAEGYDERFNGWGYEDNAFAAKLRNKWGEPQRTSGFVAHLWHPRGLDFEQPHIKDNEALLEEIKRAV